MSMKIKMVCGPEPRREGELPDAYLVGHGSVTSIETNEQNLGTYGIVWFNVFNGETLIASMNAMHVASVSYFPDAEGSK